MRKTRCGSNLFMMDTHRSDLQRLAEELAALSAEDRARLLAMISARRARAEAFRGLTWDRLQRVRGLVRLGGDAAEDTERLYDG